MLKLYQRKSIIEGLINNMPEIDLIYKLHNEISDSIFNELSSVVTKELIELYEKFPENFYTINHINLECLSIKPNEHYYSSYVESLIRKYFYEGSNGRTDSVEFWIFSKLMNIYNEVYKVSLVNKPNPVIFYSCSTNLTYLKKIDKVLYDKICGEVEKLDLESINIINKIYKIYFVINSRTMNISSIKKYYPELLKYLEDEK